jgi:hypothetical protein
MAAGDGGQSSHFDFAITLRVIQGDCKVMNIKPDVLCAPSSARVLPRHGRRGRRPEQVISTLQLP